MVQNLKATGKAADGNEGDEEKPLPKYLIDFEVGQASGRSLPMLIASRRCYLCQQADEDVPADADPQQFIDRINEHCAAERDYLLPDTPLKEAIFRALLANNNEPMDAEEIGAILTEKWTMTPFPRNTSADVVGRLAENSGNYCVARVREPEPEPEIVAVAPEPVTEIEAAAVQTEAEPGEGSSEESSAAEEDVEASNAAEK
jgi:hypothetical protein